MDTSGSTARATSSQSGVCMFQSSMDAANGGHDDSTSDTPMVDGTAEASSVGAGAVTEGGVTGVT